MLKTAYDFDKLTDRRGTGSMKWDVPEGELPMWVADMDLETAPEIIEALEYRAAHGIYGYTVVPDAWREAVAGWWQRRHGFRMEKDWLIFATGVVPAISSAVRKLTAVGENVLVQTPVYNIFFNSIRNNGRNVAENRLLYRDGKYQIDWEDLEGKLSDPQTTLMLLCNPHNPAGVIWTREELARIGELCADNHVKVISDEIHCDLTEPNVFAIDAAVAAFTSGGGWLDALRAYVAENRETARVYLEAELPQLSLVPAHATYLLWLDCSRVIGDGTELCRFLRKETGLYLSAGAVYGGNGRDFLRMNIACPKERLLEGLARLKQGIEAYEEYAAKSC